MPVDVSQVPPRLDDIPHPPLEFLGLGEPAVRLPVPEHGAHSPGRLVPRLVVDGHDEGAPRRGLQRHLAQGCGERGQELLGELVIEN